MGLQAAHNVLAVPSWSLPCAQLEMWRSAVLSAQKVVVCAGADGCDSLKARHVLTTGAIQQGRLGAEQLQVCKRGAEGASQVIQDPRSHLQAQQQRSGPAAAHCLHRHQWA